MAGSRNTTKELFSWYLQHKSNQRGCSCSGSSRMSQLQQLNYFLHYSTLVFQLLSQLCQIFDPLKVLHHWSLLQASRFLTECMGRILAVLRNSSSLLRTQQILQYVQKKKKSQNGCSDITMKESDILHIYISTLMNT